MSLALASSYDSPLPQCPEGTGPFDSQTLSAFSGLRFWLPVHDTRLIGLHHGKPAQQPALENLEGQRKYWLEHPSWMNMLDPSSPVYADKQLELGLYIHHWAGALSAGLKVLDLGGGIGRMAQWAMKEGCTVEIVDPDLRSLWAAMENLTKLQGSFDLHWSTAERVTDFLDGPYDVIIACELLNYVESPSKILHNCHKLLRPGGLLLLSVEARWGWSCARDAAAGSIEALWGDGIVHVPHDRWVRTYTEEQLRALLENWRLNSLLPTHYSSSGPFEQAAGELSLQQTIELDKRLRQHHIAQHWNRAWTVMAQKPTPHSTTG